MRLDTETILAAPVAMDSNGNDETSADFQQILRDGIAAAQSGDRTAARRLLFQASGIDPRCADVWMWLASISEYPEELLIFLGNALDIDPANARAIEWQSSTRSLLAKTFVQRAAAAHQEGAAERAGQCVEQALAYDAECALAWLWKASLTDDENEKIGYLARALEIDAENADARSALDAILTARSKNAFKEVKSAATAGRRKKALELVNEFLRCEPNIADAWILRSHLSIGLDEKIDSLRQALEIEPDNPTARSAFDFLTATVGSDEQEEGPSAGGSAEETTETTPQEETGNGFNDESNFPTEVIEKPLDSVFDLVPAEFEPEDLSTHRDDDAAKETVAVTDASEVYEVVVPTLAFENSLSDASPADFENTFLEAFHVQTEQADTSFALEEIRPFETEPEHVESEYAFSRRSEDHAEIFDDERVGLPDEPLELSVTPEREDFVVRNASSAVNCPYCGNANEHQAFACASCRASLTLSDIESVLNNPDADRETIQNAVTQMEADWNLRDFSETELTELGIGYLNLGDFDAGMKYIQEASRLDPNNVILAGQLNALAIRLDEMRRQDEVHGAMPKGKTILVVDDSATVRKLIASKLEKSGHYVICAEDGVEALQRLTEQVPDLVLLDISMPRMDGYEVCKQIRSNPAGRDLPVVMISGKDGFFDKVRGRMAGSTGYVTKPFGPETLMKALETYLLPEPVLAD